MISENKPFIYPFRTAGGYYIYDVNTKRIIKVEKEVYDTLRSKDDKANKEKTQAIDELKARGYLLSDKVKEIVHPVDDVLAYYLDSKVAMITLQVTQQCNLRCEYCVYSGDYLNRGHSNKTMSFDIAKKGIDFLIQHSKDRKRINIGFYGGEPLLEFEMIKKCMNYAMEKAEGKQLSFSITTNGTLLTEEIAEYFENNNVSMIISLDGPKEIQDANRKFVNGKGTFDKIIENVENIKEKYPKFFNTISFNVVLDPTKEFSCVNKFFTSYEAIKQSNKTSTVVSTNYKKDDVESHKDFYQDSKYEVFKYFLYKLDRLEKEYTSPFAQQRFQTIKRYIHDDRNTRLKVREKDHHGGPCVPGVQRLFIDIHGNFYPCERVSEASKMTNIGHIDSGFNVENIRRILNIGKVNEESCKNCWAFNYCTLCVVAADDLNGFSADKKQFNCKSVKGNTDDLFKDYCVLTEFGCKFDDETNYI